MKRLLILFGLLIANQVIGQYTGGFSDGYASSQLSPPTLSIYHGGVKDGFACRGRQSPHIRLYLGGTNDGFACENKLSNTAIIYTGGAEDGFACGNAFTKYLWVGTLGSGWNVAGNWNTNQVPTLRHDVCITAGATNWPAVNAGILAISRDPNSDASYFCKSITVEPNAEMTTRVNCFVRNFGLILVEGTLAIKNTQADAFINYSEGTLSIQDGMVIQGNN